MGGHKDTRVRTEIPNAVLILVRISMMLSSPCGPPSSGRQQFSRILDVRLQRKHWKKAHAKQPANR